MGAVDADTTSKALGGLSMSRGSVRIDGELLRRARLGRQWSLDHLAQEAGPPVTRQQLAAYERGSRHPDPVSLARITRALQVEPAQVAGPGVVTLADLRHWAGLTAEEAAPAFGMSRWSLLRAEATGRLPAQCTREEFVQAAARIYGRSDRLVGAALRWAERPRSLQAARPAP
ncbi:helix-turn-helix domain-containing protein [Kitasatospora sp. NPDC098652]|uniref:helix-turn-helix domain-containing protein n=1 Tax=Kitasatospora sp. NPDC098652 TaxID=3364095 RepID=UPI00380C8807